ncbi:hypothetical protein [Candidatus Mycobacterium methanotrophicum]|uniref:CRISPR-associated protein Cas6 C-terminal domain-containing protein n=1 Tax=Candidatus Mycobacterium methanotrophicum TaxID=2943498 RepID=A0ABY4QUE1_9MYCO|nr:hypothetical protein [Candidatus Mycobacterium methanotrophicum]UQX13638.1 hypothetical protein M5I08_24675 [Candidatus Mycobacterium methanotrophicum]
MIALHITATTPHGIVLSRPWGVAFDGLLASVVWHRRKWEARAAGHHLTYQPDGPQETLPLPLARCGDPDNDADWHWLATFADLHPRIQAVSDPDIRWRTSRTDHPRLQQLAPVISRQVSDTAGRYQRRVVPVPARPATHLTWRAVGDPDAIRDLLTDLPSIGKNTGVGEGLVTRWEVTETPDVEDWSAGHEHEPGVLGRSAPPRCIEHAAIDTGPLGTGALRPPYLHPAARAEAFQPAR